MAKNDNKFLKYIEDNFYNQIASRVTAFVIKNKDKIENKLSHVNYIYDLELEDLHFESITIDDTSEESISFDIAINPEISFTSVSGKHRDREREGYNYFWVLVSCKGDLRNMAKTFRIVAVDEYVRSRSRKPLDGNLVPYVNRESYDECATRILQKYYPEALDKFEKVNPEILAQRMGLTIIHHRIRKDGALFGKLFFDRVKTKLYNEETESYEEALIEPNTIIVDEEANFFNSYGNFSLTIAHECTHYFFHRKAFLFARLINSSLKSISCMTNGGIRENKAITDNETLKWVEIQANAIAPCLLLPKSAFLTRTDQLLQELTLDSNDPLDYMTTLIERLAVEFDVSKYAVRKRLIDLGFHSAIGSLNYIDGGYLRPYTFNAKSLGANETFSISEDDFFGLCNQPEMIMLLMNGDYVFVENHLCLNDEKYITTDILGNLILTDYALHHIDECCVKFRIKTLNKNNSSDFTTMCYLCRELIDDLNYELEVIKNPSLINNPDHKERMDAHNNAINNILKEINFIPYNEGLMILKDKLGITIEEVSFELNYSDDRQIRRYFNGEVKNPTKAVMIGICCAMQLPMKLSDVILRRAGCSLIQGDPTDDKYYTVLSGLQNQPLAVIDKFLTTHGIPPLSK